MLGGLAMKWKWRARARRPGSPPTSPNLILGIQRAGGVGEVLPVLGRRAEVHPDARRADTSSRPERSWTRIDENTIGVVAILGTTYTGEFEPIEAIHDAVVASNAETGFDVPVHIDAASGGFVAPFLHPNVSGTSGCPW